MTIAVTGATGHLGRLVLDELRRARPAGSLVALVRDASRAQDLADDGVRVRVAAYEDPAALVQGLADVDTLLLVSGSEVGQRVAQHRNVIDAAVEAGVRRIVYTSAPRADSSPLVLAPEHRATEEMVRAAGSRTILRNNWYTENYVGRSSRRPRRARSSRPRARAGSPRRRADSPQVLRRCCSARARREGLRARGRPRVVLYRARRGCLGDRPGDLWYRAVDGPRCARSSSSTRASARRPRGFVVQLDLDIAAGLLAETTGELSRLVGRPTTPLVEGCARRTPRPRSRPPCDARAALRGSRCPTLPIASGHRSTAVRRRTACSCGTARSSRARAT